MMATACFLNEKKKTKRQKLAKLGNGEPVTTPPSFLVRMLNKKNRIDEIELLLSDVHEDVQQIKYQSYTRDD